VLLPRKHQFKISYSCVDHGDYAHPLGYLGTSRGHRNRARDWRGAKRSRKGRNPRKARFFAQQKMRPNNTLQVEALYWRFSGQNSRWSTGKKCKSPCRGCPRTTPPRREDRHYTQNYAPEHTDLNKGIYWRFSGQNSRWPTGTKSKSPRGGCPRTMPPRREV
jgi:hypothetical protein